MAPDEIRLCRELSGLTQTQAAKIAGVARGTWNRYELGHAEMPEQVRHRCSKLLSNDPLKMRRHELAKLIIQWAGSEEELRRQALSFVGELVSEWKYGKPFYKDEKGRAYRNPNFKGW